MTRRLRAAAPWVIGITCGAAFMMLTLRELDAASLAAVWSSAKLWWLAPGAAAYCSAMFLRALRWKEILRPLRPLEWPVVTQVLVVGYGLNYLLPARLGELLRAHYARDRFSLSRSSVLGTIVVERTADLLIVVLLLITGIATVVEPGAAAGSFAGALLRSAVVLLALITIGAGSLWVVRRARVASSFPGINRRIVDLSTAIRVVTRIRPVAVALVSAAIWGLEAVTMWALLMAVGVPLTLGETALLMSVVCLSTLIPSAPGFVGTLQFAFYAGLTVLGYSGTKGVVAATLMQLTLYLPVAVAGVALMFRPEPSAAKHPGPRGLGT